MGEISNVLYDNSLPDDAKSSRFNEKINAFTVYVDKIISASSTAKKPTVNQRFYRLPKTFQQPGNIF